MRHGTPDHRVLAAYVRLVLRLSRVASRANLWVSQRVQDTSAVKMSVGAGLAADERRVAGPSAHAGPGRQERQEKRRPGRTKCARVAGHLSREVQVDFI